MLHCEKTYYQAISNFWGNTEASMVIWQPWQNVKYQGSTSPPATMHTTIEFLRHALQAPGNVAEFGVFRGASASMIAAAMCDKNKTLFLLDTFAGIPSITNKDIHWKAGDFKDTSIDQVKSKLNQYLHFIKFYEGDFSNILPFLEEFHKERFCFVHIDSDTYESVKSATEFCYPRMNRGGVIIYDDYGDYVSIGARTAVDEFYRDKRHPVLYMPSKQAVVLI